MSERKGLSEVASQVWEMEFRHYGTPIDYMTAMDCDAHVLRPAYFVAWKEDGAQAVRNVMVVRVIESDGGFWYIYPDGLWSQEWRPGYRWAAWNAGVAT